MLHVRVTGPSAVVRSAVGRLADDECVVDIVVVPDVVHGGGDLLLFDVARENANAVLGGLRHLELDRLGSIAVSESDALLSAAARRAERLAPGDPSDAVIWDAIEARAWADSQLSWSFLIFLTLATAIAGIGRYLDQPILIIGAMVVGPEFAPVAAISLGLASRRRHLVTRSLTTLLGGYVIAILLALVAWSVVNAFGGVDAGRATSGRLTAFIVQPDIWSVVIALFAGSAGVLSMTASKSATLVGVFISVTTVPAAATIALVVAVGAWGEARSALVQLMVNLVGLVVAGTLVLTFQRLLWRRTDRAAAGSSPPARPDESPSPR